MRQNPNYRDSNSRPNVSGGYEVTNCVTEATGYYKQYIEYHIGCDMLEEVKILIYYVDAKSLHTGVNTQHLV